MLNEWSEYKEYVFTLKDGTEFYEICKSTSDVHDFQKMHGAVSAKPINSKIN